MTPAVEIKPVHIINHQAGCWPTKQQELLLRAALLENKDSIKAWHEWQSISDIDNLDSGSFRLLPLVYRNLSKFGLNGAVKNKLKGMYRLTWYSNHMLFSKIAALLASFRDAGLPTIILKGAALTISYYKDYGARPMADFDFLVKTEQAHEAMTLLRKLGWKSNYEPAEKHIPYRHSIAFNNEDGFSLDLHWHVLYDCCREDSDIDFWDAACKIRIKEVETHTLGPTDQILNLCVHGIAWNPVPPFRWIPDVVMVMNSSQSEIDWKRLADQSQKRQLLMPVKEALNYLRDKWHAPIPSSALAMLDIPTISAIDRLHFEYRTQDHRAKALLGGLPPHLCHYLRLTKENSLIQKIMGLAKYFQYMWKVDNFAQLLFELFAKMSRRLRTVLLTQKQNADSGELATGK